ncbi:hypothetical protein ACJX0J_033585, partial [Zea mays]
MHNISKEELEQPNILMQPQDTNSLGIPPFHFLNSIYTKVLYMGGSTSLEIITQDWVHIFVTLMLKLCKDKTYLLFAYIGLSAMEAVFIILLWPFRNLNDTSMTSIISVLNSSSIWQMAMLTPAHFTSRFHFPNALQLFLGEFQLLFSSKTCAF